MLLFIGTLIILIFSPWCQMKGYLNCAEKTSTSLCSLKWVLWTYKDETSVRRTSTQTEQDRIMHFVHFIDRAKGWEEEENSYTIASNSVFDPGFPIKRSWDFMEMTIVEHEKGCQCKWSIHLLVVGLQGWGLGVRLRVHVITLVYLILCIGKFHTFLISYFLF